MVRAQQLLVAFVQADALCCLGPTGHGRSPAEVGRRNSCALQFIEEGKYSVTKAARLDDATEVVERATSVQFGDQSVGEQTALHLGQRPGLRMAAANDLVGEVLEGA